MRFLCLREVSEMLSPQVARLEPKFQQQKSLESKPSVGDELTDGEREEAIKRASSLMERRYADYAATGDFGALGEAHQALLLQRQLIAGRSKAAVFLMEIRKGLI
jgi:hypothetical protein